MGKGSPLFLESVLLFLATGDKSPTTGDKSAAIGDKVVKS
ncbi:hypothetical protein G3A_11955 [Bacillus sp. 17376]|nr:hypothetical protein G3A_11955 [Bacillus sp. 17376]